MVTFPETQCEESRDLAYWLAKELNEGAHRTISCLGLDQGKLISLYLEIVVKLTFNSDQQK